MNINNLSQDEINDILFCLAECINEIYGKDIEEAKSIVYNSSFPELLKKMPEFILHYNFEYWAEEIMNAYKNNNNQ